MRPGREQTPRLTDLAAIAIAAPLALSSAYLLALLVAAGTGRRGRGSEAPGEVGRLVVLIPAHDEQGGIAATLRAVLATEYPRERLRVIVIADNCTDATAAVAGEEGAEVWERTDPRRRGKGHALGWALERLRRCEPTYDGIVVLDADCEPSPNLPAAVDRRLRAGAAALQVDYVVDNPAESTASALRFAGFALMNTVRFRGKERLGLSCGLVGTGMAFSRRVVEELPWRETGLTEDAEYHMRIVLAGERAEFVAEARITSPMPTSLGASADQQARWERGRLDLMRRWVPRMLAAGVARRDPVRIHAALEPLVPPQSLLAAGGLACAGAGAALRSRRLAGLGLATVAGQSAYVLGGLALVGAPAGVYRALLAAPALVASKLLLYARIAGGRGPSSWVRTAR